MTAPAADRVVTSRRGQAATAALYDVRITHVRTTPLRNAFTYRSYQWLVALDRLPTLPLLLRPLARFEARDHLGDPSRSLRENVDAFLAQQGVDLRGGRILMLANARALGHVVNPLTVFWCHDAEGELACVVAEVHNTYGERHCYLLRTDVRGRADAAKEFYVSPFHPVDGVYRMSLPEPGDDLDLTITLHRPGSGPFVASMRGTRLRADVPGLLRCALRSPLPTVAVSARIRYQGIKLFLRRLPVQARPAHRRQEKVQ